MAREDANLIYIDVACAALHQIPAEQAIEQAVAEVAKQCDDVNPFDQYSDDDLLKELERRRSVTKPS